MSIIKIGSRKSQLAIKQTEAVIKKLKEHFPNDTFEIVIEQDDVASIFGDARSTAHGYTDMCAHECWYVVDAIARHCSDVVFLKYSQNTVLMLGDNP